MPVAGVEARGPKSCVRSLRWATRTTDGHRATPRDGRLLTASCHDAVANLWTKCRIRLKSCPDCAGGSFSPKVGQPQRPVGVGERATSWSSCLVLGTSAQPLTDFTVDNTDANRRWDDLSLDNVVTFAVFAGAAHNGSTGGLVNWAYRSSCYS